MTPGRGQAPVPYAKTTHGGVECGPNAVLALAREGNRWTDGSPRDLADSLGYAGFWRLATRHCLEPGHRRDGARYLLTAVACISKRAPRRSEATPMKARAGTSWPK